MGKLLQEELEMNASIPYLERLVELTNSSPNAMQTLVVSYYRCHCHLTRRSVTCCQCRPAGGCTCARG